MSNNENENAPKFSIRDKRRAHLDEDKTTQTEQSAEDRPAAETEPAAADATTDAYTDGDISGPSAEDISTAKRMADESARHHTQEPAIDFNTLVISFASSAVVHMGHAPHPDGDTTSVNLPMAKQTIDMLCMLKTKTQGNLEPEEAQYLEAILYDLRLRFVEASKAQAK